MRRRMPISIMRSSSRTAPSRPRASSGTSRPSSRKTQPCGRTSASFRAVSGKRRSSCSRTESRSRRSVRERKSADADTNNGGPTLLSATTSKTTRTSTPPNRERSSATGFTRRSQRRETPIPTSCISGRSCTSTRCLRTWRTTRVIKRSNTGALSPSRRIRSNLHRPHQRKTAGGGAGLLRGARGGDAGRHRRPLEREALLL